MLRNRNSRKGLASLVWLETVQRLGGSVVWFTGLLYNCASQCATEIYDCCERKSPNVIFIPFEATGDSGRSCGGSQSLPQRDPAVIFATAVRQQRSSASPESECGGVWGRGDWDVRGLPPVQGRSFRRRTSRVWKVTACGEAAEVAGMPIPLPSVPGNWLPFHFDKIVPVHV